MEEEEAKLVSYSKVEMAQLMIPSLANPAGNVHGGTIMKIIDETAFVVASRHTRRNCVTASVDRINFLHPVFIGNVVYTKASVNYVASKSMEIGVTVEAEDLKTGRLTHVGSAYLTFVALDEQNKAVSIPKVIPETEIEKKRFEAAQQRYESRKAHRCLD